MIRRIVRPLHVACRGAWRTPAKETSVLVRFPGFRAFAESAVRWCRTGAPPALVGCCGRLAPAFRTTSAQPTRRWPRVPARCWRRSTRNAWASRRASARRRLRFAVARARRMRSPHWSTTHFTHAIAAEIAIVRNRPGRRHAPPATAHPDSNWRTPSQPEAGVGCERAQKHFSASSLNAYAECARKWFYRYACSAVEDPGSAASAYGTAFHLALEDFHAGFPRPERRTRRRRCAPARCRVRAVGVRRNARWLSDTPVEFEFSGRRAQRTAQRYVDWLLLQAKGSLRGHRSRSRRHLDLEGHPFVGFIDRLDRRRALGRNQRRRLQDGSIAKSAAEYREKVRRFKNFNFRSTTGLVPPWAIG